MRQAWANFPVISTSPFKSLLAGIVAVAMTLAAVDASIAASKASSSKYAAIVVDANTGKTLFSANADAPRYPASLTKMMTLYMVFEALNSGKLTLSSRVPFSAQAASRAADETRREGRQFDHGRNRDLFNDNEVGQ